MRLGNIDDLPSLIGNDRQSGEDHMRRGPVLSSLLLLGAIGSLSAAARADGTDWGKFPGYTLRVKLIGGTQYEKLYTRIPEWEKATGAKVEIVSSKNHFDLDREIKQ